MRNWATLTAIPNRITRDGALNHYFQNAVGFAPQNSVGNPFNPATNHLTAVDTAGGYEARGMVTKLGSGTVQMQYDAEGNMKNTSDTGTGQSVTWIFDAQGRRAQKLISGGSWTLYVASLRQLRIIGHYQLSKLGWLTWAVFI